MAGVTSSPPSPHEKVENPYLHNTKRSFVSVLLSNNSNENQPFKCASNKIEPQQPSSTFIGTQQIFLGNEVAGNTITVDSKNIMDNSLLKPVFVYKGRPSISFQQSEKLALFEKLQYVLIAKSSHGRPSMVSIRSYISGLQLKGDPLISVLDSKHLVIECKLFEDFTKLWTKRSWVIGGFSFRIFKWSEDFNPQIESPLSPVWIHLPRLPLYLFDEAALMSIGNAIGKPLRLDRRNTSHAKLAYASICVELDVSKPRIDDIWISFVENGSIVDGFWQHVVYDTIPPYCVNCKHLGHTVAVCKRKILQGIVETTHTQYKEAGSENSVDVSLWSKEIDLKDSVFVLGEHKRGKNKGVSNLVELENIIEEGEIVESTKEVGDSSVRECCVKGIKQVQGMIFKGIVEQAKEIRSGVADEHDMTAEVGLLVQKGEGESGETGIGQESTRIDVGSQEFTVGKVDAAGADTPGEPVSRCLLVEEVQSGAGSQAIQQADVEKVDVAQKLPAGESVTAGLAAAEWAAAWEGTAGNSSAGQVVTYEHSNQIAGPVFSAAENGLIAAVSVSNKAQQENDDVKLAAAELSQGMQNIGVQAELVGKKIGGAECDDLVEEQHAVLVEKQASCEHATRVVAKEQAILVEKQVTPPKLLSAAAEFTPKWAVLVEELVEDKKQSNPVLAEKEVDAGNIEEKSATAGGQVVMITNNDMEQLKERLNRLRGNSFPTAPSLATSTWVPPNMSKHLARELKKGRKQYRSNQNWQDIEDYSDEESDEGDLEEKAGSKLMNGNAFLTDEMGDIPRPLKIKSAPNSLKGRNSSYDSSTYLLSRGLF